MKKILAVLVLAIAALAGNAFAQAPAKPDIIEVIEITGEIGNHTAASVASQVEKINENSKVKGVLLLVNSPGGGALASSVLYQELAKIKVPVVGFCEYLCASGGIYALMSPSVKYIAVREETIGGSVGVVMQMTRFHKLLEWAKIESEVFKSGALKDAGNPTRAATDGDRKYLQNIVDTLAEKFYGVVQKARPKANMAELKTAKIFIGEQIIKVGLADAVMTREEAVKKVKDLSGSKNAFTREELGKVIKNASEAASMRLERTTPRAHRTWEESLSGAMDLLDEIRAGETVKFSYRLPLSF